MSGYNYSYKVFKKYVVDIFEFYEETSFTRAFIYRRNSVGKDLIEIKDFPNGTERDEILKEAAKFITSLEKLIAPLKIKKNKIKTVSRTSEKSIDDL